MTKYHVTLTRTVKQDFTLEVIAASTEAAENIALMAAPGDILSWDIERVAEVHATNTTEPGALEFID